jgi:hypothetical protein
MRVALCIASRGNPEPLFETLQNVLRRGALPQTKAVIGLDEDDPTLPDTLARIEALNNKRIVVSVAPRGDTIGSVYNRCAAAVDADVYVNGVDDFRIATEGWDAVLADAAKIFPDGIGVIGFGDMPVPSGLPACEAATRGLIEKMGYFVQDYTPYWWMDSWLFEIATMIGRFYSVPIEVRFVGPMRTRGMRDLLFWAQFYDAMRVHRRAVAKAIVASANFLDSPERKRELIEDLDRLCAELEGHNAVLRDPGYAKRIEASGFDAPASDRYLRAKERAQTALQALDTSRIQVA